MVSLVTAEVPKPREPSTKQVGAVAPVITPTGPPTAIISIKTVPAGAEVVIDGKSYGPSPVRQRLALGKHVYSILKEGVEMYSGDFELKPDVLVLERTVRLGAE